MVNHCFFNQYFLIVPNDCVQISEASIELIWSCDHNAIILKMHVGDQRVVNFQHKQV